MFLDMLKPDNTEFQREVAEPKPSKRLQTVLDNLQGCQVRLQDNRLGDVHLKALLTALDKWRTREGSEYTERGDRQGVAYRLWMETKQLLKNSCQQVPYPNDPPMPTDCPGSTTLGVYVPQVQRRDSEICHAFAYRWLVASGKLSERVYDPRSGAWGPGDSLFLYPHRPYPRARAGGRVMVWPGDLVGMFDNGVLTHSLIAITETQWFAVNNSGTFGDFTPGRTLIDFTLGFPAIGQVGAGGWQVGWVGADNQFTRCADGHVVDVIYRRL
jgi:hypothetical protein